MEKITIYTNAKEQFFTQYLFWRHENITINIYIVFYFRLFK